MSDAADRIAALERRVQALETRQMADDHLPQPKRRPDTVTLRPKDMDVLRSLFRALDLRLAMSGDREKGAPYLPGSLMHDAARILGLVDRSLT